MTNVKPEKGIVLYMGNRSSSRKCQKEKYAWKSKDIYPLPHVCHRWDINFRGVTDWRNSAEPNRSHPRLPTVGFCFAT